MASTAAALDTFLDMGMTRVYFASRFPSDHGEQEAFAEVICRRGSVTELWMGCSNLRFGGTELVARMMRGSPSLVKVDVSSCNIDLEGAVVLAAAVRQCPSVRDFCIGGNTIEAAGGLAFADLLRHTETLQRLDLCACYLDERALCAVAEALRVNRSLRELDCTENPELGEAGWAFADALTCNRALRVLRIDPADSEKQQRRLYRRFRSVMGINWALREVDMFDWNHWRRPTLTRALVASRIADTPSRLAAAICLCCRFLHFQPLPELMRQLPAPTPGPDAARIAHGLRCALRWAARKGDTVSVVELLRDPRTRGQGDQAAGAFALAAWAGKPRTCAALLAEPFFCFEMALRAGPRQATAM
jgi:hypothetical protein